MSFKQQYNKWVIIGAGRLGKMMGLMGRHLGAQICGTWNRDCQGAEETALMLGLEPERCKGGGLHEIASILKDNPDALVWLTVVDDVIEDVASFIADWISPEQIVVHTAGSLSSQLLTQSGINAHVASLHPLQAIADSQSGFQVMSECVWTLEGDVLAKEVLSAWMREMDIVPVQIEPKAKVVYHAAAVTSANLLVALMDAAYEMAGCAGLSREQARLMLLPLARSSLENLETKSTAEALTGPVARGDRGTVERHEEALGEQSQELLDIYRVLTQRAWELME